MTWRRTPHGVAMAATVPLVLLHTCKGRADPYAMPDTFIDFIRCSRV